MTAVITVLDGLAVLAVAIVAGCYVDGALVLLPAQRRISAAAYTEVQQATTALGTVRYRLLLAGTVALQALLLAALHDPHRALFWLTAASAGILVGTTALITVRRVVPINRLVHTWDPGDPPADWTRVRDRWHRLHRHRTTWAVLALVVQVTATLAD